MAKRKRGAHEMHVKELIWLAQSQCYGVGRKKLIWGCQGSLLKNIFLYADLIAVYSVTNFTSLCGYLQIHSLTWLLPK